MATRSFEFMLGTLFLLCGGGSLLLHRFLGARFKDSLKEAEVSNGIKVMQFYYGIGIGALVIGSVLVVAVWIAYA